MTLPAAAGDALAVALAPLQEHLFDAFFAGRNARTVAAYRQDLEDFRAFVATRPELAHLVPTSEDAAKLLLGLQHGVANALALAFRASMVDRRLAPATINRRLAALRSVVKLGNTLGLVAWKLDVENIASESYRDTRGPGREAVKEIKRLASQRQDAKGLSHKPVRFGLHPTEKPESLLGELIEHVCPVGGVVLDSFFGSCSAGRAAVKRDRRFIGIERDRRYFELGWQALSDLADAA